MDDLKTQVIAIIKDWFQNQGFHARKLTDTPTDDLQVTNKKYSDTHIGTMSNFQWDNDTATLTLDDTGTIKEKDATGSNNGLNFQITGANGGSVGGNGGALSMVGGDALAGNGNGGDFTVAGGAGNGIGHNGNVDLTPQGSFPTSSSGGFIVIPHFSGTPTGTPTQSCLVYDTSADKLWIYNGSWRSVTLT